MTSIKDDRRVMRALGNLCNDTISDSEARWLASQLHEFPEVRDLYVDYMSMHACISSEVAILCPSLPAAGTAADPAIETSANETTSLASTVSGAATITQRPAVTASSGVTSFGRSWLALAATLLFVLLAGSLGYSLLDREGPSVAQQSEQIALPTIARITSTQDCRWGELSTDIGYGSTLHAGQTVQLREGLAEITFEDGATMLLESPTTVIFESGEKIAMLEGRMAAIFPPESQRLSIHTKTLDLCNVDAEFGLLARDSGASELHVFTGSVEANFLDTSGQRREQMEVRASEAVLASPATTTIFEFPANETRFVRSMSPTEGPHDGLLAYEGFTYPAGPLSAQNGGFGWAGPWSTIAADNVSGSDTNLVRGRSLSTHGVVPRGNHAAIVAQRNRIRRSLASSLGGVFDVAGLVENQNGVRLVGQDGTTVYFSFLQRVDRIDDGFYGIELHRGDGNDNRVLCIGNGADETGYGVTSAVNVYGLRNFPSLGHEDTDENFFVVKISYGANNRDTVEVFRNPESLKDENLCQADATLKGNFAFDRISLANFDGSKIHEVDELRVGVNFLAVTSRWGGERGRLQRRFTKQAPFADSEDRLAEVVPASGSNTRNLALLGAFSH
ncbi:MAG: hypothetical protein AAGD11_19370 [Planctomycetota bacterium]